MPQYFLHTVILAGLYVVTGKIGLLLAAQTDFATVIWPPSGIALGMLLVYGYRLWPGVLIGAVAVNGHLTGSFESFETMFNAPGLLTLLAGIGTTLQAVLGRYLILKIFDFPLQIERARDAFGFLALAGPVSCLVAATVSASSLYLLMGWPADKTMAHWMAWWAGDTFGVLTFMPCTLIICSNLKGGHKLGRGLSPLSLSAFFAVFLSIVATLVAWKVMNVHLANKNEDIFVSRVEEAQRALSYKFSSYQSGLLGASGFFAGSNAVEMDEWQRFVQSLDIEKNYKGINGIGFIAPVDRADLDTYVETQRAEGRPDFDIRPDRDAENFFIIQYIEPVEANTKAVGLNIAFEKNRYDAAVEARDSGKTTMTRKIALVQDADRTPGFLILHPVYRSGMPVATVAERRAAFLGWIYAPFTVKNMMHQYEQDDARMQDLYLQIYEEGAKNNTDAIYTNRKIFDLIGSIYKRSQDVDIFQQKWTLTWSSTPAFERRIMSNEPFIILFSGLAFTSLLSMFLIVISQRTEMIQREVERKTQQYAASEGRMRMLVRHTPAAVAMFDRDMRYIMTSERWIRDYNLFGKEVLGRSHYELFPEIKMLPEWMEYHRRALAGESLSRDEDIWHRPDGRTEWLRWALHPWRDDSGNIGGIIMFTEIITDAKNSKAELLRSNAALEEFAYVVSHDLKAPLRHISMCSSFFEESMQGKLDDESRRLLNIMRDSSEKMRVMIESLLDYSRIGRAAGEYKLVDLNRALADALVALTPQIEASGAVVQADALPSVRGSQMEMTRVFQNLVENAIKYRRDNVSPVVKIKSHKRDGQWELSVSDNGIGIDPKFSAKIFQLFQRLHGEDSPYTGAGIGLAVCQRIVHYHGGQIWLDPDYQDGCRFIMTLPDMQTNR